MQKHKKTKAAIALLSAVMLLFSACGNAVPPVEQNIPEQGAGSAANTDESAAGEPDYLTPPTVLVNGVPVPDAFPMSIDLEHPYMPTHVVLMAVLRVLEAPVTSLGGVVTVEGPGGTITFEINSEDYTVNGEVITLDGLPSFMVNGTVYVPIRFFRDVFGMNNAYFEGGTVQINNEERME